MKKIILIIAAAFAANVINAQLKVDSLGYVNAEHTISIGHNVEPDSTTCLYIKNASVNPLNTQRYGIMSIINGIEHSTAFGIRGVCGVATPNYTTTQQINNAIGVMGICEGKSTFSGCFGAGVAGVGNKYNTVGVYGKAANLNRTIPAFNYFPVHSFGGAFAGYFDGDVKVTGALTANTITETSDERLKDNIVALPNEISDGLLDLKPISFKYTKDSLYYWYEDDAEPMTHTHYGLVAQEVKEVFPALVYEDGNGYLSVNYIEIIPLLISTVKQQNEKLAEQDARIAELEKAALPQAQRAKAAAQNTNGQDIVTEALLLQNTPNPFSEATVIGYTLPGDVAEAAIYVYDMQGTQLQKHELAQRGEGTLTISGGTLRAGMYLYSLIADGRVIDTKRMILTE